MILLEKVSLTFAGKTLFQDVSFTLQSGERCGLVGRNGSGKSTLLSIIRGELEHDQGNISIPKGYTIGCLEQHIKFSQTTLLDEAILGLPQEERDQVYQAEKILFGLGFCSEDMLRPPSDFSGGYHLRLQLAKVLLSNPDCLLLDEPTNYLDIQTIRWLARFLKRWSGEIILISHDRDFMDQITTHTMGIHRGSVKKIQGSTIDYYTQLAIEEEVYARKLAKDTKRRAHLQSYIDRFGAKASKAKQARARKKALDKEPALEKLNALAHLNFQFKEAPFHGKKMLDVKGVCFTYTGQPLIEDVSLSIEKGERIAIIGQNGRGKSTLLRLLLGELKPTRGSIRVYPNSSIAYFGQTHIERLNAEHTILDEIMEANPELKQSEVRSIAGAMMFSKELSEKKISILSGGERSRVLLGKMIAISSNVLMLDEPTHHLDIESIEALIDALEDFNGAVMIVTHSELILRRLSLDRIVYCDEDSQKVFLGTYDEFLDRIGFDEKSSSSEKKKKVVKRKPGESASSKQLKKEISLLEKEMERCHKEHQAMSQRIESGELEHQLLVDVASLQETIAKLEEQLLEKYEELESNG